MTRFWRRWVPTVALGFVGLWALDAQPSRAQMNTYADVPFNQGSLFYRPSGARPPQTTVRRTVPAAPAPVYRTAPQRGATYYYPSNGTYYYPQHRQRRGLFGLFR